MSRSASYPSDKALKKVLSQSDLQDPLYINRGVLTKLGKQKAKEIYSSLERKAHQKVEKNRTSKRTGATQSSNASNSNIDLALVIRKAWRELTDLSNAYSLVIWIIVAFLVGGVLGSFIFGSLGNLVFGTLGLYFLGFCGCLITGGMASWIFYRVVKEQPNQQPAEEQ